MDNATGSSAFRVVMLTREAEAAIDAAGLQELGGRCTCVASPYEAAAEILAAPTLALVVDLSLLAAEQLRLLEVARRMDIEILAFGAMAGSTSAEQLSGVRLTARGDLLAAIRRALEAEQAQARAAGAEGERPVEPPPPKPRTKQAEPHPAAPQQAETAAPQTGEGTYQPTRPADLLTPEELSALLENEP